MWVHAGLLCEVHVRFKEAAHIGCQAAPLPYEPTILSAPCPPQEAKEVAYINLDLSNEEKEKGNAAFKEQRCGAKGPALGCGVADAAAPGLKQRSSC